MISQMSERLVKEHMEWCTSGYQPPEHIERGEISKKFDIFSLGVIMIKIVSGPEGFSKCADMSNDEFIDIVGKNWRNRLQATWRGSLLDAYCNQVERCIEIALSCVEYDSNKRPSIMDITKMLNETETEIGTSMLLEVDPLQLQFPFETDNSMMSCSLQLTNNTNNQVIFRLVPKSPDYFLGPLWGVVASRSRCTLVVTRRDRLVNPPVDRDEYFTLESSIASNHEIQHEISDDMDTYNHFFAEAKENGREMNRIKLTVVYGPPEPGKDTIQIPHKRCSKTTSEITLHSKDIPNQQQHFKLMTSNELQVSDIRDTSLDVELVVGRTEEKNKITFLLERIIEEIIILPIHGIGGIGKTTFAKLIYDYFKTYYRVWVYVSPRFDLNEIGNSIISQLSEKESETNERQVIHSCLTKILSGKEILIVLDDLWEDNPFQLEDLKTMLSLGKSSKIIVLVTTRSEHIAEKICFNHKPYKIEYLTSDMCWDIIKQRSGFEARYDKEYLMSIGREIALKCRGVALAAQSLGFMLQSMTSDQWIKVKDSDILNGSVSEEVSLPNNVLASLRLSYKYMPPNMKLCFAYCAMFPKGHKIVEDDLIYQWISLGFIKPTKLLSPMQLCKEYIVQLIGLSFLKHSVSLTTLGGHEKGVALFTMHGLVHDLARLVMSDDILDGTEQDITGGRSCRYALLTDCGKPLELSMNYPEEVRSLRFLDCGHIKLHSDSFSSAHSLRVLDLRGCSIYDLPTSIGELMQLKYLNAPNVKEVSNCFTKLSKLIYLNLSGSQMEELPWSIGEIESLLYLDISDCRRIQSLPKSFVNLKKLVHLDCSNCISLTQQVDKALGVLNNLQYLNLSRLGAGWYTIQAAPLYGVPEIIRGFFKLRYLCLSYALDHTFAISQSATNETFSFVECICTLSTLEHLDLSHNCNIANVPERIASLRKLHTLDLSFCIRLVRLPECLGIMHGLRNLNVTGCSNLDKSTFSISKIVALFPHFMVHTNDDESSSNICLLRHANPEELHISGLDNVKSAEEVKSIELIEKQRIKDLKLKWTIDAPRSVEDVEVLGDLVPPSTLRKFNIEGYNSVGFPAWVMGIKHYLPNLIKIVLCDLRKCNSLPPLGQLSKLQELVMEGMDSITTIEEGFCGGARAFRELKKFHLCHMGNLETWNTMYSYGKSSVKELMFPNLEEVSIGDCPKLRLKPCPPRAKRWEIENSNDVLSSWIEKSRFVLPSRFASKTTLIVKSSKVPLHRWRLLHHLPSIIELRIIGCTDLACSSRKIMQYLPFIESLWLEDNVQPELPKWLGDLIFLRELIIRRCTQLSNLQKNMQHLTSIQLLCLSECPSIPSVPECLGAFASLKELVVRDCRGIKSLPNNILAKLQLLYIYYCPELVEWCELEENKQKLAQIQNKIFYFPSYIMEGKSCFSSPEDLFDDDVEYAGFYALREIMTQKQAKSLFEALPSPTPDARTTTDLTMSSRLVNPSNYASTVTNPGPNYAARNAGAGAGLSNGFTASAGYEALPSFRDVPASEKPTLFLRKFPMCCVVLDFTDPTKDVKEKEVKRQTLLALVDYITSATGKFPEPVVQEVIKMVSINLFRVPATAPRENKVLESFDLEEEPVMDPAWSHLQIVYELFLRFIQSPEMDAKMAKRYIDHSFIIRLLDLFDLEDPREREYLKTILHRIYGKFMAHRPFIRKSINNIFYRFIFETEKHNGIAELLEILGNIINGFALPLKEKHKLFLVRALIPLHKPKCVAMYHQQLSYCVTQFVEKDCKLADTVIRGLLKYWPITNSSKEVMFLGELEVVLEATQPAEFQRCMVPLFRQIGRCLSSYHFHVAERALFLWNNDHIEGLIKQNNKVMLPIIFPALERNTKGHWNQAVQSLSLNVRKIFMDHDPTLFEECRKKFEEEEAQEASMRSKREDRWKRLEEIASSKSP
ncbi:hypothetical protein BS78_07G026900 [Paspalum vaginatum]|nr:hypothetical protein BS78_07G026900 [Paspalum vaginatum]